jgi:FkbM family methyltransferase
MFHRLENVHVSKSSEMTNVANIRLLRRFVIPILRRFGDRNLTIKHPLTGSPLCLHAFKHKGYWFHGADREKETLQFISKIVKPGIRIFDIGAHIGYLTCLFAKLTGRSGTVIAFEPGINNVPYLKRNTSLFPNVRIEEFAVSNQTGTAEFLVEDLSGQNNSLVLEARLLDQVSSNAFCSPNTQVLSVPTITLDDYCERTQCYPDLMKIDTEGAEFMILSGATNVLSKKPILIVEVTEHREQALELLWGARYVVLNEDKTRIRRVEDLKTVNIFCLP